MLEIAQDGVEGLLLVEHAHILRHKQTLVHSPPQVLGNGVVTLEQVDLGLHHAHARLIERVATAVLLVLQLSIDHALPDTL